MDQIDPVSAFNAWNLSVIFGLNVIVDQHGFANQSKNNQEQQQIIESGELHVVFKRDGQKCYISETLRKEPFIIDGVLMKELGSKLKRALSGSRKRFVVLDFKKQLIRFKHDREDVLY